MPKDILGIDFETVSRLKLPDVGGANYFRHPTTRPLMMGYQLNKGKIDLVDFEQGEEIPREIEEALVDPEVEKWAWNAPFEIGMLRHSMGREVDMLQWRDTMVLAMQCSFPGSLEKAGPAMGFSEEECKMDRGKVLMRRFSIYGKISKVRPDGISYWYNEPENWEEYCEYCRRDVSIEGKIRNKLLRHNLPDSEWEMWRMDQDINERGLPLNIDMVMNADQVYEDAYAVGRAEMERLTGLANPMSHQQLLPWLKKQGYPFDDLKKGHVQRAYDFFETPPEAWSPEQQDEYCENETLEEVLQLRLNLARTSIKKFAALKRYASEGGVVRGTLQMNAALRTGRWGGRMFQPQNLARPNPEFEKDIEMHAKHVELFDRQTLDLIYPNLFDLLASTIRPAAQAPEGQMFIDADLNAIENRVLGWMTECSKILEVFEKDLDPYLAFGTYLYKRPYDELLAEYQAGEKTVRTISKPGVLGCGYMLSAGQERENSQTGEIEATGLLGYAWNMGVKSFTLAHSELSVSTFREQFREVKSYWYAVEKAMKACIRTGKTIEHGVLRFDITDDDFLRMRLPSGRFLYSYKPRIQKRMMPWREEKPCITYMEQDLRKQWVRTDTHPGKITENADQAISRDLLAHGMRIAYRRGLDIRLHVHDQILATVDEDKADRQLKILIDSMEEQPDWAEGLPLKSAGFICKAFQKD